MPEKLFILSRNQRKGIWRRFKQTLDRHVIERLHVILRLDCGQNAEAANRILYMHPKTLKCRSTPLLPAAKLR